MITNYAKHLCHINDLRMVLALWVTEIQNFIEICKKFCFFVKAEVEWCSRLKVARGASRKYVRSEGRMVG